MLDELNSEASLSCYSNLCPYSKHPSYVHLRINPTEKKQINARTIPFLSNLIKMSRKESLIFVISGNIISLFINKIFTNFNSVLFKFV
jgi:hypothetical protein